MSDPTASGTAGTGAWRDRRNSARPAQLAADSEILRDILAILVELRDGQRNAANLAPRREPDPGPLQKCRGCCN